MAKPDNRYWGSTLDDFLKEEGIYEEVTAAAIKEVTAWQRAKKRKKRIREAPGKLDDEE